MPTPLKKICVYCGSRSGAKPAYAAQARALGALLAAQDIELVYGGGNIGLMGIIANEVLEGGSKVTGVIPETLAKREVMHHELSTLHIVDNMHTRKAKMIELGDAFIAMPGGLGTYEELFEVLTWAQLGIHAKPIGLLNVSHYFDPLLHMIDHAVAEGFVSTSHRNLMLVEETPEALLEALTNHVDPMLEPKV